MSQDAETIQQPWSPPLLTQLRMHDLSLEELNGIIQQDREEYLLEKITPPDECLDSEI